MQGFVERILIMLFLAMLGACQASETKLDETPDYSETPIDELQHLHKKGDVHATFTLGFNHFFNDDNSLKSNVSNVERGLAYLQEAHDKGHIEAHSSLSTIYQFGLFGIPEDFEKANKYSLQGAQRGSNVGKLNYGLHNLSNQNKEFANRAHDYLIEVATEDYIGGPANEHLSRLYYFGNDNFETNYESARLFAENCILFGDSEGWCEFILARDLSEGWGGPKHNNRSAELFIQAGEKGYPAAMWYAGINALNGTGVIKNEETAFEWVKKSSESDYGQAMISLGVMYALGQGTEINYEKAYASYTRAAKLGSAHAIRSMAGMHCDGQGRPASDEICFSGVFLAMEHGDDQAPLLLKNWFTISDTDVEKVRISRPSEENFWTSEFPWLLESDPK